MAKVVGIDLGTTNSCVAVLEGGYRLDLLAADKYATMTQRLAERDRVNTIVAEFVGSMDREALLEHCLRHEVPAGPINNIADIFADPQFAARRNLVEVFDPREGRVVVPDLDGLGAAVVGDYLRSRRRR